MKLSFKLLIIVVFIFFLGFGFWYWFRLQRSKKAIYHCPVEKEFCLKGEKVNLGGNQWGIKYKVPAGAKIFTVAKGDAQLGKSGRDLESLVDLIRLETSSGIVFHYQFLSEKIKISKGVTQIEKGQELGSLEGKMLKDFGAELVLSASKIEKDERGEISKIEFVSIFPSEFGFKNEK